MHDRPTYLLRYALVKINKEKIIEKLYATGNGSTLSSMVKHEKNALLLIWHAAIDMHWAPEHLAECVKIRGGCIPMMFLSYCFPKYNISGQIIIIH